MRLTWRKRESESSANSTALVVIEVPADELLVEEPASEEPQGKARRVARLLARSRRLVRRLNPVAPARVAVGKSGQAAKSVVVKLHPRRLARAIREFRRIGPADLARRAHDVSPGSQGRGRSAWPRLTPEERVEFEWSPPYSGGWSGTLVRALLPVWPAKRLKLARTTIARLDPRRVEDVVRRVAESIDSDGKEEKDGPSGGTKLDRIARAAVAKIGPERAVKMAKEATKALKRLVARLDPDQVAEVIGELVAAAKAANDKKGRLRVVGFLASLVKEVGRAFKSVAQDVEFRDVVVVLLVVLTTAPELLVAAGVSVAAIRVLTSLLSILVQMLPDRGST